MTAGPDDSALRALHAQLRSSMEDVSHLIDAVDGQLSATKEEWTSKGAHEFSDAWVNGFRPSLAKLCQALAVAGTDVAFQHHRDGGDDLDSLTSPR
jgi:uncharacterized protein YukE